MIILDPPVQHSVVSRVDQKSSLSKINGNDVQVIDIQSSSSKVQEVISIGSRYLSYFKILIKFTMKNKNNIFF